MENRLKLLRKELKMSQEEFAKKVNLTKNYISLVETGNRSLADRTVKDICRIFNVNENWLRGEDAEMFLEKSKNEQIADLLSDTLSSDEKSFKKQLISALAKLDDDGWDTLEKIIDSIPRK